MLKNTRHSLLYLPWFLGQIYLLGKIYLSCCCAPKEPRQVQLLFAWIALPLLNEAETNGFELFWVIIVEKADFVGKRRWWRHRCRKKSATDFYFFLSSLKSFFSQERPSLFYPVILTLSMFQLCFLKGSFTHLVSLCIFALRFSVC